MLSWRPTCRRFIRQCCFSTITLSEAKRISGEKVDFHAITQRLSLSHRKPWSWYYPSELSRIKIRKLILCSHWPVMGTEHKLPKVTPFSLRATARTPCSWAPLSLRRSIGWCLHKLHKHQPSTVFQPIHLWNLVFSVQVWFLCGIHFHSVLLHDNCLLYLFLSSNDLLSSHWPASAFWALCC